MELNRREFCRDVAGMSFAAGAAPQASMAKLCALAEEAAAAPSSLAGVAQLLRYGKQLCDVHFSSENPDGSFDSTNRMWSAIEMYKVSGDDGVIFTHIQEKADGDFQLQRALLGILQRVVPLMRSDNQFQKLVTEIRHVQQKEQQTRTAWLAVAFQRGMGPKEDMFLPLPLEEQAKANILDAEVQRLRVEEDQLGRALVEMLGFDAGGEQEWSAVQKEVHELLHSITNSHAIEYPRGFQDGLWDLPSRGFKGRASTECASECMHQTQQHLETMAIHLYGDTYKNSDMLLRLAPRVHALCIELSQRYFPEVTLSALHREVHRLEQKHLKGMEEVRKMMEEGRRQIDGMFAVPHVEDDRLYMRLHQLCKQQRAEWEREMQRQHDELFETQNEAENALATGE